jgi:hypothetical protein
MGNIAITPGFEPAIAGTGPVFLVFLIPHILAGLTAIRGPRDLPVFGLGVLALTLTEPRDATSRRPSLARWQAESRPTQG